MNVEQTIKGMTKAQKEYIGVWGNQWAPRKTVPFVGTCERCVWGSGVHDSECPVFTSSIGRLCGSIDAGEYGGVGCGSWPHSSGE